MFRAVLLHLLSQLVIHVISDTNRGVLLLRSLFANDLGLDWPHRRERLNNRFGLELNCRLHQQRVEHTTRTGPRFCPILIADAKDLQTFDVGIQPVLA